jgi:hypothetical protein
MMLADLAVGSLEAEAEKGLTQHLSTCAACRRELTALQEIAAAIDVASVHEAPPADLEQDVVAAMLGHATAESATALVPANTAEAFTADPSARASHRSSRARQSWRALGRMRIAVAVPSLALAVVCLFLVVSLNDEQTRVENLQVKLDKLEGKPSLDVLNGASIKSLDTDAPFEDARVQMALTKDGGVISLRNVPAPPDGRAWQVWQVDKDKKIRSIGVITEARELIFLDLDDIDGKDLERIIITSEPAQGSNAPSSEDVARGSI